MMRARAAQLDPLILWCTLALALIGLVMVTSASLHVAARDYGGAFYFSGRQMGYLLVGFVAAAVVYCYVPLALLRRLRYVALAVAIVTLLVVLVPGIGSRVNGSRRWINLVAFTVQASEIVKLCFVIYLAGYIDSHRDQLKQAPGAFVGPMAILGFFAFLLLLEPDFGAVVVLGICALGMLMMAGVPAKWFAGLMGFLVVVGGVLAAAESYRVKRLMTFLDPWNDQFGDGYQLVQSLIAFGRGHWTGAGLGQGVQKLFYLPEAHTDFVFAVLAEELGLVGVCAVLAVFAGLGYAIFRLARRLEQENSIHAAQLVYGIGMIICAQAFINMGVTMGLLPTKGLTLPFVSYGGSSLVISFVMVALVLRAAAERTTPSFADGRDG